MKIVSLNQRLSQKKYNVIVIDPPWEVKKIIRNVRPNQISMDYPMLSIDNIKSLPVNTLANDNCLCFIWTIQKYLFNTKDILESFRFKHLLTIAWDKSNGLCLFGFHYKVEFIVVGYKGKIDMYPHRTAIPCSFQAKSEKHSAKPDEFYKYLSLIPGNKLDMFARKEREGWDVWGNEVKSNINLTV
jgi:N6-adenosine-specific RNA methylase IME4